MNQLSKYMENGDVAGAIHEIEDSFASGHQYKPWHGGLPGPSHLLGDSKYHTEAQAAARRYLRAYNNKLFDAPEKYLAPKPKDCSCAARH